MTISKSLISPTKSSRANSISPPLDPWQQATSLVKTVCFLAGPVSFLDDTCAELHKAGLGRAVTAHDTPAIYNWLVTTFSYQGISDQVARGYIEKHGSASWSVIEQSFKGPCCDKLRSYWQFNNCKYNKSKRTCSVPHRIEKCPLPRLPLRNGRLNQMAASLFLFIRDIAGGDLVAWIESQLASSGLNGHAISDATQEALIGPMRNVYGVSDKVLNMALSSLFLGVRDSHPDWFNIGVSMVTIDSLVHNFLHRTGVLQDLGMPHQFGPACYQPNGCAQILRRIADQIDARLFNPAFPTVFPRFIQYAIWRYCAAEGLNICNGVKIDDRYACADNYCRVGSLCRRNQLK